MKLNHNFSDDAILIEIGRRIAQHRLNLNKTQSALAFDAGVSSRTMSRIEHGESVQGSSLIRILRALNLIDNLDALIPAPVISPLQQLKMHGKQRQRASSKSNTLHENKGPWVWGDNE